MKELIDLIKTHNVWLASVARAAIAVGAAFGLEMSAEQMTVLIVFIEVVFGVSQAKSNIAETRVDGIVANRMSDLMAPPPPQP